MSGFKHRLWTIIAFGMLIVLAVAVSRAFASDNSVWAAALPWVLLVLFWICLFAMSRRDQRRGQMD